MSARLGGNGFQFRSWQFYVDKYPDKLRITARDHAKIYRALKKEIRDTILRGYPVLVPWIGVFYVAPTHRHRKVNAIYHSTRAYREAASTRNGDKYNIPVYPMIRFRQYVKSKRNLYRSYNFTGATRLSIKISRIAAEKGLDHFMQPDSGYYI